MSGNPLDKLVSGQPLEFSYPVYYWRTAAVLAVVSFILAVAFLGLFVAGLIWGENIPDRVFVSQAIGVLAFGLCAFMLARMIVRFRRVYVLSDRYILTRHGDEDLQSISLKGIQSLSSNLWLEGYGLTSAHGGAIAVGDTFHAIRLFSGLGATAAHLNARGAKGDRLIDMFLSVIESRRKRIRVREHWPLGSLVNTSLLVMGLAGWFWYDAVTLGIWHWGWIGVIGLSVSTVLAAIVLPVAVWTVFFETPAVLTLYRDGVRLKDSRRKPHFIKWTEIDGIQYPSLRHRIVTMTGREGQDRITFSDNFREFSGLVYLIEHMWRLSRPDLVLLRTEKGLFPEGVEMEGEGAPEPVPDVAETDAAPEEPETTRPPDAGAVSSG